MIVTKEKRINIMGSGPGWQDTPIDDGEIWGVNNTHMLRNVDRIIDVHHNRFNPEEMKDKAHMHFLKKKMVPTYAQREIEGNPYIKAYPLEEVIKEFGADYFGSGIDYIIALAIYEGATDIHLYGICMLTNSEYSHQKASVEFWLGYAMGRGINVEVHGDKSTVLKTKNGLLYGYGTTQKYVKERYPNELTERDLIERYEK
jgi:hypothetical protein